MKTYFVTGTGTGIGKTYVSALLAKTAVRAGLRTAMMKPVQTGMTDPMLGDLGEIRRKVSGILEIPSDLACPYCLAYESSAEHQCDKGLFTLNPVIRAVSGCRGRICRQDRQQDSGHYYKRLRKGSVPAKTMRPASKHHSTKILLIFLSGKHPASRKNILTFRRPDRTYDTVGVQPVAEPLHHRIRRRREIGAGNPVKTYQIHSAFYTGKHGYQ